jgi:hypothetical protein
VENSNCSVLKSIAALLALVVVPSLVVADGPMTLEQLHGVILPGEDELAWMEIPWMSDLWEARKKATEEGKPLFLWEMDGHPLGCT